MQYLGLEVQPVFQGVDGVPHVRLMGVEQCVKIPRQCAATVPMDYNTLDRAFGFMTGSRDQ
jgi:hypothetical protein